MGILRRAAAIGLASSLVLGCSSGGSSSGGGSSGGSSSGDSSSGGKTYPTTFTCAASGGTACPNGQECPKLPLGSGGCGDLPGVFEHAPIKVDSDRPEGCKVGLPYGNPYYGDTQQECNCQKIKPTDPQPKWICPL